MKLKFITPGLKILLHSVIQCWNVQLWLSGRLYSLDSLAVELCVTVLNDVSKPSVKPLKGSNLFNETCDVLTRVCSQDLDIYSLNWYIMSN